MSATVMRGIRIRLEPTTEQAELMDLWRKEAMSLWNILLGVESAAYSGDAFRPELKWRELWREVALANHERAMEKWRAGDLKTEPAPPDLAKIAGGPQGPNGAAPQLFLWDDELQKVMARLKKRPTMQWLNALPSHAAQQICKDLVKAIRFMLSEKKKPDGLDVGFPNFKKRSAYAAGNVYLVNTQTRFDHDNGWVHIPKMAQPIPFRQDHPYLQEGTLMGARIWRQGKQWWMSCQFKVKAPEPRPRTGRVCGLKMSSGVLGVTWDGKEFHQYEAPKPDKKAAERLRRAKRRMARRKKGSQGWLKAADDAAQIQARTANLSINAAHEKSREIVNAFDAITVHDLKMAPLMKREDKKGKKRPKSLVKLNHHAAVARFKGYVKYKAEDEGRVHNQTATLFPEVQICSGCGKLHYMPLEKRIMNCDRCGLVIERRRNAAVNEFEQGEKVALATKILAAE